ncbi:MAG: FGGY family carbohydrate kinase [Actinobacteria bacterium]|nr:FGGY family carbohydrate kinase [Actinomycetota bacterium]
MNKENNPKFLIGFDIGTTNIKGSLYSTEGELIDHANVAYNSYTPQNNYHEQNPADWVKGFMDVMRALSKSSSVKKNILAMSLSTQGGTMVPVDKDYKPLHNAITWLDRRGEEILNGNNELLSRNVDFYNKTGWRLDTEVSFMPLYWLKEKRKDIFGKIHKVLFVNDYMTKVLAGVNFQDPSNASITLFFNVKKGKWDSDILNLIGLREDNFSEVKNSGEIVGFLNDDICSKLNIEGKVAIVNGGHDQYCSAIGAGILDENEILLATGTAWVIFKMLSKPLFDSKRFFAIGRNLIKDKFGLIYAIPAAGASLKWFALNVMNLDSEKNLFQLIGEGTDNFNNKKNNILFYPYLTGNFGPDFNLSKKASFYNLEVGHNYVDLAKAIMEGVGFQLNRILMVLKEKNIETKTIKMVGGATKSKIWPSIISDITNSGILIPKDRDCDFATKGAAILAGYGIGVYHSLQEGYEKMKIEFNHVKPKIDNNNFYKIKFNEFLKCYF